MNNISRNKVPSTSLHEIHDDYNYSMQLGQNVLCIWAEQYLAYHFLYTLFVKGNFPNASYRFNIQGQYDRKAIINYTKTLIHLYIQ